MRQLAQQLCKQWVDHLDEPDRSELIHMDDTERGDVFYRDLSFGTGSLRGKVGLGSNRMNADTAGRATQGLADCLNARSDLLMATDPGADLAEAMESLCAEYGYWGSALPGRAYEGSQGAEEMASVMASLREDFPSGFAGVPVGQVVDYAGGAPMPVVDGETGRALPPADVVELRLSDGSHVLFRPSGTEPKAKAYVFAKGAGRAEADEKLVALREAAEAILGGKR